MNSPTDFDLVRLVRPNIARLTAYSSARKEYEGGAAQIFLDANENSFGSPLPRNYNRYPDPLQSELKTRIAARLDLTPDEIFLGNGSDEAIDLLLRIFCAPQTDSILICPPTYGMYEVLAEINDVSIKRVNLTPDFQLDIENIKANFDENTKLLFICSPNNPTGSAFSRDEILSLAAGFHGVVIVDEAYGDFSTQISLVSEIRNFPNLVVLQTFSKAWGMAGARVGIACAQSEIIGLMNKIKLPYNISQPAQEKIAAALDNAAQVEQTINAILSERARLISALHSIKCVTQIYPTDANFVLVKTVDAPKIYNYLLDAKIVVRNRSNLALCAGCLRVTVGTPEENDALIVALEKLEL